MCKEKHKKEDGSAVSIVLVWERRAESGVAVRVMPSSGAEIMEGEHWTQAWVMPPREYRMKALVAWEKRDDGYVPIRINSTIKTLIDLKAFMGLAKLNGWEVTAVELESPERRAESSNQEAVGSAVMVGHLRRRTRIQCAMWFPNERQMLVIC